ncbi:MAG: T9SS type A sorting domain-containing protein [Lewinellaceae bacterium]|nr:T9SS type A sorting domain-containing protein [Lewinellaceae bacterium]
MKFGELSGAGDPAGAGGVQLLQNRPNPFSKMTTIGFVLPVQTNAQLRVYDLNGRLIQTVENNYPAGYNEEKLHLEGASGLLFYELITPFSVLTKRMMAAK